MSGFRAGFIGATTSEANAWISDRVGDAKSICVPFAGSGKDVVAMCGPNMTIESWDTQLYSRAIIEGVFAAESPATSVDKLRYRKGYMYQTHALKYIDDRSAGFIDWVAEHGTLFDKACLASAVVRCTLIGRMTQWYANPEQLWTRFNKARAYNAEWVNRPGTFVHTEGSFFDNIPTKQYALMQVDPPKVVVGSDVYSANFNVLNKALGGKVESLPKWSWRDVKSYFRQLLQVDAERIIFMYVSGVRPSYEEVKEMVLQGAVLEEEQAFPHRGRTDYGLIVRRTS